MPSTLDFWDKLICQHKNLYDYFKACKKKQTIQLMLLVLCDFLTIVLDDAFEVVCHQILQGTFVGQTEAVRKHNGCVYNGTVG